MNNPPQSLNPSKNKSIKAMRARSHDYRAPGYYHITIASYSDSPRLSEISMPSNEILRKRDMIIPNNTILGECVKDEMLGMARINQKLQIKRYVIMPDHIHFVLQVTDYLEKPIGSYIAPFTKSCSQAYTGLFNLPKFTTLFKPFDDEIIFNHEQLDRTIKYIEDNPCRYLLKQQFPDLFKRHMHIVIDGHEYAAYGNIFLLKGTQMLPIRVHRYWDQAEFDQYRAKCIEKIAVGAIPITPAIHKAEKDIVRTAIDGGGSVILLRDLSFNERFKPQGEFFDLCAAGRLLLISPWPDNLNRRSTAGPTEFHKMNDYASAIASLPASSRLSLRFDTNF